MKLLSALGKRYFDGDKRKGPRKEYLIGVLKKYSLDPKIDKKSNIWIDSKEGEKIILISSHYDIDPAINKATIKIEKSKAIGIIDNVAGCWINLMLAKDRPKGIRLIQIFSASEEVSKNDPNIFARSAKEIVATLKKKKIKPDIIISLDVTYPKFKTSPNRTDWKKEHNEIFDHENSKQCYIDGFDDTNSKKIVRKIIRKLKSKKIGARKFFGHDESFEYSKFTKSFALGPVVYGKFDEPNQVMPLQNMYATLKILKKIIKIIG